MAEKGGISLSFIKGQEGQLLPFMPMEQSGYAAAAVYIPGSRALRKS